MDERAYDTSRWRYREPDREREGDRGLMIISSVKC